MRSCMFIVFAVASTTILGAFGQEKPPEPPTGPRLEMSTKEVDFGLIYPTENQVQLVMLTNTGDTTLHVKGVTATCVCAEWVLLDDEIAPGTSTVLEVHAHVADYPLDEAKSILLIETDDPATPVAELHVSALILPEYEVRPEKIDFGEVKQGSKSERTLIVRQCCPDPLEILGFTASEHVQVEEGVRSVKEKADKASERTRTFIVRIAGTAPEGRFSGKVELTTNVARVPKVTVPVRANVVGIQYEVRPSVLTFAATPPGGAAGSIEVLGEGGLLVAGAETDVQDILLHVAEIEPGRRYRVDAIIAATAEPGRRFGQLRILLREDSLESTANVSFYGNVE